MALVVLFLKYPKQIPRLLLVDSRTPTDADARKTQKKEFCDNFSAVAVMNLAYRGRC